MSELGNSINISEARLIEIVREFIGNVLRPHFEVFIQDEVRFRVAAEVARQIKRIDLSLLVDKGL